MLIWPGVERCGLEGGLICLDVCVELGIIKFVLLYYLN